MRSPPAAAAVLLTSTATLVLAPSVFAQEVEPPPSGGVSLPSFPSPVEIAGAFFDRLGDWLNAYIANSLPALVVRGLLAAFGWLANALWDLAAALFGATNILTQLPGQWVYELDPVQRAITRLSSVALATVGLAAALTLLLIVASLGSGRSCARYVWYLPRQVIAGALLVWLAGLIRWWVDFCNALSGALADPRTGLAGLGRPGFDQYSALAVIALVYAVVSVLFFFSRAKVLVHAALLTAVSPLAIAAWVLPVDYAQRFASWWLGLFLGITFVQVPQAVCLAIGAALMASLFAGGDAGAGGVTEGALAFVMGIGSIGAAWAMPGMLSRQLARGALGLQQGQVSTALHLATMLAGIGIAAGPTATVPVTRAVVQEAPRMVRSLLGDAPKLLPPPR